MTLHDESLLTAYLDGELDPESRSTIESALLADPELAEQLRQLTAVHELVAGLPRADSSFDLSPSITAAIAQRRRLRRLAPAALAGLALAASVLIAVGLALRVGPPAQAPPTVADRRGVATPPAAPSIHAESLLEAQAAPRPAVAAAPVATTAGWLRKSSESAAVEHELEAEKIRAMLDDPGLKRILIVTDVLGGVGRTRIEDMVRTTPRTEAAYGRITISQGIVIDPRHPNEATVFVLTMNEQEHRLFEKKLAQAFPRQVEAIDAEPEVVTNLADIGQVTVLPGTRASAVLIPGDVTHPIALKDNRDRQDIAVKSSQVTGFGIPDLPAASSVGAENAPGPRAPADALDAGQRQAVAEGTVRPAPNLHDPPAIVLVWVTAP